MRQNPAQCLYLGDDLRDMQAANAAEMRGIIANYGYVGDNVSIENWKAQGSVDRPTELIGYLIPIPDRKENKGASPKSIWPGTRMRRRRQHF